MGPREASESQPTSAVGSDNGIETSRTIHPPTRRSVASTARITDNHEGDRLTAPTSLPVLPRRGQPFPFILPHPLGDVSPPQGSCSRTEFMITNTSTPASASLQNANHLQVTGTMGSRRMYPGHSGGLLMPHPTTAPTTGLKRGIGLENMIGPGLFSPHHGLPRPSDNQTLSQHAANRWQTLAIGTRSAPRQQEDASLSGRSLAEDTHSGNWEMPQYYHKCDECNADFASSTCLQRHETTHLQRFRCGCGAAYIDETLLLVSIHSSSRNCAEC